MLDTDTKRRIDTCRDILVGKVPDPKSQVEQITIALIYKFMDDMDAEAEVMGGKRSFFTGDHEKFGWSKLMAPNMSGFDVLSLYSEAIQKMNENPGVPVLFRDIFKHAYLPYRDPETLRSFLKEINGFTYDHSERLGDAFEYLLSCLSSQGDAGMFRTPRNIIDFMVEITDPKKDETLLDPACGTAGFLISAYKHILKHNTKGYKKQQDREAYDEKGVALQEFTLDSPLHYKGDLLTPDDRKRLAANIHGYDISPDMVRLSLVNMYLHGFTSPHIDEYDTLTSDEKWNALADVILANPPFMSPKGGIKPHKRFSVQATRSEVLFVDYIAEHLTPNGRAAIVVPEGIIFQSQTAYKQLRKLLVENYLVAVVSLPAGVFNPYSGVKTSILILDKRLAKKSDAIAFFKIENDGYGLGAQRRPIEKNDLPAAAAAIKAFRHSRESGNPAGFDSTHYRNVLVVEKSRIAANGDYNLSGERYREVCVAASSWPFVPVSAVFRKGNQTVLPESLNGPVTYLGLENITQNTGKIEGSVVTEKPADIKSLKNIFKPRDILYGKLRPNLNKVWLADRKGICSTDIFVIEAIEGVTDPALYAYLFRSTRFNDAVMGQLKGAQLPRIGWSSFAELQIPLPPLEVQKEIVAEIEGYQKVINGARAVLDHYRPHIPIHPDWPMVELGEVCSTASGGTPLSGKAAYYEGGTIPWLRSGEVAQGNVFHSELFITEEGLKNSSAKMFTINTVLVAMYGATAGEVGILRFEAATNQAVCGITPDERLSPDFLYLFLKTDKPALIRLAGGGAQPNISQKIVREFKIPLPPLATQQAIVAEIEAEQALVAANRELVARFEKKIQATLARVWGEDISVANKSEDK